MAIHRAANGATDGLRGAGSTQIRLRFDSDPTQIRLRFDSDPTQIRLRFDSDPSFDSDPTQIRLRFDSDPTQIRLSFDSDSTQTPRAQKAMKISKTTLHSSKKQ